MCVWNMKTRLYPWIGARADLSFSVFIFWENIISVSIFYGSPYALSWRALVDVADWIKLLHVIFCLVACDIYIFLPNSHRLRIVGDILRYWWWWDLRQSINFLRKPLPSNSKVIFFLFLSLSIFMWFWLARFLEYYKMWWRLYISYARTYFLINNNLVYYNLNEMLIEPSI